MNKARIIISMLIFGTIGIFVTHLSYPSAFISLFRSVCGSLILLLYALIFRKRLRLSSMIANLKYLLPSGIFLGLNWVFLFEAYRYTDVSFATLCYYMAPVFVIILSPIVLKKRSGVKKIICAVIAAAGMVILTGTGTVGHWYGTAYGLGAALLYALIVLLTSRIEGITAIETTITELGISSVVLLPYVLLKYDLTQLEFDTKSVMILLILGIVHTGIAYLLYFGAANKVPPQTVAVYSYVDPITAILLSSVMARTFLSPPETVGAVMILGAAIVSDLKLKKEL